MSTEEGFDIVTDLSTGAIQSEDRLSSSGHPRTPTLLALGHLVARHPSSPEGQSRQREAAPGQH